MIPVVFDLMNEARRLGVKLTTEGGGIRYAPRDRLPAELIDRLKQYKPEVIAALSAEPRPCATCGSAIALLSAVGTKSCPACEPQPAAIVRKLLIVVVAGRNRWADYDAEMKTKRPNM